MSDHIKPLGKKKHEMTYTMWFPADEVHGAIKGFKEEIHNELKGDDIEGPGSMEEDEIIKIHNKWFPVFKEDKK